jgi:hypothetical protein
MPPGGHGGGSNDQMAPCGRLWVKLTRIVVDGPCEAAGQ